MLFEFLSAVGIFLSLTFSSLAPYCLLLAGASRRKDGTLVLSLCNCVACGIFLSTCFLGLIPHVRHHEELLRHSLSLNTTQGAEFTKTASLFLSTEFVVLAGFLVIFMTEQAIFACSSAGHGHTHSSPDRNGHRLLPLDGDAGVPLVLHFDDEDGDAEDIIFRKEGTPEHCNQHADMAHMSGHSHAVPMHDGLSLRSLLLLLGLSIHSVFEGIALGLQKDRVDFVKIMIAIMLHEVLCCIAWGVSLAGQSAPRRAALISTILLSACIPAGMGAAFVVDVFDSAHSLLLRFLLEGLAAGTFIYVAAAEMLPAELHHSHGRQGFVKSCAVVFGALVFLVFQLVFGNSHGK